MIKRGIHMHSFKVTKLAAAVLLVICLVATLLVPVSSASDTGSINSAQVEDFFPVEDGFSLGSCEWSPDGNYLLLGLSKPVSMFDSLHKHYLIDVENKTYGQIDYGITEEESKYISNPNWFPSGDRIYFSLSKHGDGSDVVICNPDGTGLRALGSPEIKTLSKTINATGNRTFYRNLIASPDYSKIAYEYEDPEHYIGNLRIENIDGTNPSELYVDVRTPFWLNSTEILFVSNGKLIVVDVNGNIISELSPEDKDKKYYLISVSPDKQKMAVYLRSEDDKRQNYVCNIDGSNSLFISELYDWGSDTKDFCAWQPNGSLALINDDGNLFLIEGKENRKSLLYEGNVTTYQWFPDGKKVLFVENEKQMYSIDINGTNLSYITDIGLTFHYFWEQYEEISISPSGDTIAFTSGLYSDGESIDSGKAKRIAAPLFVINSDGTNLTQLTSAINGIHAYPNEWDSDGKMLTANYLQLSDRGNGDTSPFLFSLDGDNLTGGWQELPVSQIYSRVNSTGYNKSVHVSEKSVLNNTSAGPEETKNKQSPSFRIVDLLFAVMCLYLLKKRGW
jgi:Tol biopolymer transport system component